MAHREQVQFCKKTKREFPEYFRNKIVVDIGSMDINGNNRRFFRRCDYSGIDIKEGKNVDYIGVGHELLPIINEVLCRKVEERYRRRVKVEFPIRTMISTECLEHDKYWMLTMRAMYSYLQPGGMIIITCAGVGRPEHGTSSHAPDMSPGTNDYYKNITNEMFASVYKPHMFEVYHLAQDKRNYDLQFFGIKILPEGNDSKAA